MKQPLNVRSPVGATVRLRGATHLAADLAGEHLGLGAGTRPAETRRSRGAFEEFVGEDLDLVPVLHVVVDLDVARGHRAPLRGLQAHLALVRQEGFVAGAQQV